MKLYLTPDKNQVSDDNGVGKVVAAQFRYLPDYGVEFVSSPREADIVAAHIFADFLPEVDVLHLHGLLWTADKVTGPYNDFHDASNRRIVEGIRKARAVTMPSYWATMALKRDMRLKPTVIPNGVDLELWQGSHPNGGYVLWNKNRVDGVCDPRPAYEMAKRGAIVVSTMPVQGVALHAYPENYRMVGKQPYSAMVELVKHADVYLATTQEVFSLSVLEALAAGVPVLGYAWGGTAEAVRHKETGYLVEPGDVDGLITGLEWLKENRDAASQAARQSAQAYSWREIIQKYAHLYRDVYERKQRAQHRVAVVLPCFNYGSYLAQALESVLGQTKKPEEIIVVNDGSTDNTVEVALSFSDRGVKLLNQDNLGVAHARNTGIATTDCEYIVCLDADDALDPRYIETLLPALKVDRALGVVWANLRHMNEDGTLTDQKWNFEFKWEEQASPDPATGAIRNGIPCAAMFRRSMWERCGGYKQTYHPAEDAEFWLRGLSVGFTAKRVSDKALFYYRTHEGSASRTKPYGSIHHWHPWAKDKKYPLAAPSENQPKIRSYNRPLVSVIIPVGPLHAKYLPSALDSLLGQTFRDWEAIVVDDTLDLEIESTLIPYPFVKYVVNSAVLTKGEASGGRGAGSARNAGLEAVTTPLCLFLDADDYLMPTALEEMVKLYSKSEGRYVYTDWLRLEVNGEVSAHAVPEYSAKDWLVKGQHAVTVLMATEDASRIGGFDEKLIGWEDWDFFIKCAVNGICGVRLPRPLFGYRMHTGTRREDSFKNKEELLTLIRSRYSEYMQQQGGKELMACGCGSKKWVKQAQDAVATPEGAAQNGRVLLEFIGPQAGTVTYLVNGNKYSAANNPFEKLVQANPADVQRLLSYGNFRVLEGAAV